jgi:hypothetical protein
MQHAVFSELMECIFGQAKPAFDDSRSRTGRERTGENVKSNKKYPMLFVKAEKRLQVD